MQHVIYAVVCTEMHVYCTCMHCIELYATGHKPHAIRAQTARLPPREGGGSQDPSSLWGQFALELSHLTPVQQNASNSIQTHDLLAAAADPKRPPVS